MFVMPCAIVALLSLCLSFLCFGLMVRTWFRPYGLCHCLYTKTHIKGFRSPYLHVYACLLLCFILMLAILVLGFATLDALNGFMAVWLQLTPARPFLDVIIWEASPNSRLLCSYPSYFLSTWCYAYHACLCHLLAFYASLHTCLHVHPRFNTMKLWTFYPNLHLSPVDTTFCLPFCLFAFSLVCLLSCFFACHVCHAYLLYASFTCLTHLFLSIACLLVSCSCLCMYTHEARTHGARAQSPRRKQKGRGCMHVNISQVAMFSSFRGLAFPIWLCTL